MTADDRFDDVLGKVARDYQRPPETPREEIWARIEAARRTAASPTAPSEVRVLPFPPRRRLGPWMATAVAASLVLGIAIGRIGAPEGDAPAGRGMLSALPPEDSIATTPATPGVHGVASGTPSPDRGRSTPAIAPTTRKPPRLPAAVASSARESTERTAPGANGASLPYRVVAGEHLVRSEALLVSLRSDLRSGWRDTTIAVWAGDLLGTTRMLLDSPAGEDRQMKRLLEDLELVLAQIARLHQAPGEAADLELIDEAVRQRQVMTRLRALSPGT